MWEESTEGRTGREGQDNGEVVVGEGEVDEKRDWSGETAKSEHSPMVSVAPTTPPALADDTPPSRVFPDNRRQSGIPSSRFDGEGITPSPFLDGGDVAVRSRPAGSSPPMDGGSNRAVGPDPAGTRSQMGRRPVRTDRSMDPGTSIPPFLDRSFVPNADWVNLGVASCT